MTAGFQRVEALGDEIDQGVEEPVARGARLEQAPPEVVAHRSIAADDPGNRTVELLADLEGRAGQVDGAHRLVEGVEHGIVDGLAQRRLGSVVVDDER